jgi:hypothetical protein
MAKMYKQIWYCDTCCRDGTVKYGKQDADVMSVVYLLSDDHKRVSPDCSGGSLSLRVVKDRKTLRGLRAKLQPA